MPKNKLDNWTFFRFLLCLKLSIEKNHNKVGIIKLTHRFSPNYRITGPSHTYGYIWKSFRNIPANARRWTNAWLLLAQHGRRWASINPALVQRLAFAGMKWFSRCMIFYTVFQCKPLFYTEYLQHTADDHCECLLVEWNGANLFRGYASRRVARWLPVQHNTRPGVWRQYEAFTWFLAGFKVLRHYFA